MKGRLFRRVTKDLEITSRTSTRLADGRGSDRPQPRSTTRTVGEPLVYEITAALICEGPMQRLYGGTRMRNRDGSRGGARLEYPGPSSREEVNRDECGREHPFA